MRFEAARRRTVATCAGHFRSVSAAKAAGMSRSDVRDVLDSTPAAFSYKLADAWQISDSILRQIAEAHAALSEAHLYSANIHFRSKSDARVFRRLKRAEVIEWLKANKYYAEVAEVYYKVLIAALIEDLVAFAMKALECAVYGPLTVGFALLRKPLKDNLFALEWMLADPDDYFSRFFNSDAKQRELRNLKPERKIEIIRQAMVTTQVGEWFPAELMYQLRFDKNCPAGLEPLWQKANHLVTTQGVLATEAENLNFVFSTADDRNAQWEVFYGTLPVFLFHALAVYTALIRQFARPANDDTDLMPLRTVAGMALWMRSKATIFDLPLQSKVFMNAVRRFIRRIKCPRCGTRVSARLGNIRRFFQEGAVQCFPCRDVIVLNNSTDSPSPPL